MNKRLFKPIFAFYIILGLEVVLDASLFILLFKSDLLHELVKKIFSHQKFDVFWFDSRILEGEVQHLRNVIDTCRQIIDFFAFFDGLGHLSF